MTRLQIFLFPSRFNETAVSRLILALRIVFGLLLMTHGVHKLMNFGEVVAWFPDPLGIGSTASLSLVIFSEVACSLAFIAGFLYRLALIPMIVTMGVAFFAAHGGSLESGGELALIYLAVLTILYYTGPGRYAVDFLIRKRASIG